MRSTAIACSLLAGCAVAPGTSNYKGVITPDGGITIEIQVAQDSELADLHLVRDAETGRVTELRWAKRGAEGQATQQAWIEALRAVAEGVSK